MKKDDFPFFLQPKNEDEGFMLAALKEAWKAFLKDEVPVGAVVTLDGKMIAKGWNQVEMLQDATAHAEVLALTAAEAALNQWRLEGAVLYSTLEPCCMCAGAAIVSRIQRIVWGAPDIRQGANGSWIDIFSHTHPIHQVQIFGGVYAEECGELLRRFFRKRREEHNLERNPQDNGGAR